MEKRIDHPKVFISYSWGTNDHQDRVLAFATRLMSDGIDVILDKWDLSEGNDMNSFMEKCVNDSTVTNVLMLLDRDYSEKADNRRGGVGTETQIISAKVYQEVNQDKFIPIVFERDSNGNIYKPTYLQSRLHFDLSQPEQYEDNYTRLVRKLFGVDTYRKPEIGSRPNWVDEQVILNPIITVSYDSLKGNVPETIKRELLIQYLNDLRKELYSLSDSINTNHEDDYLNKYDRTKEVRSKFLLLLRNSAYVSNAVELIASFFEDTFNGLDINSSIGKEICLVFLHELFIYTVGGYIKNKDFSAAGYILGKTYFNQHSYSNSDQSSSYFMFYSGSCHDNLDNAVKSKDNKRYHSGTANYWITTIDSSFLSKEDFVEADLMCFNYSIYGDGIQNSYWNWFPVTYVYDNEYNSRIKQMAKKLVSKEHFNNALILFNWNSEQDFKNRFLEIESQIRSGAFREYRYSGSFESAPILGYFINTDQLATLR